MRVAVLAPMPGSASKSAADAVLMLTMASGGFEADCPWSLAWPGAAAKGRETAACAWQPSSFERERQLPAVGAWSQTHERFPVSGIIGAHSVDGRPLHDRRGATCANYPHVSRAGHGDPHLRTRSDHD